MSEQAHPLVLELPDELLDALARRVAAIIATDHPPPGADEWLRGADAIAGYIACPPSRVYALSSSNRIPVTRDGSALLAKRSELDAWLHNGGGKRP